MVNNLLSAATAWRTVGSVLLALVILVAMITIHEFGHYVAGKIFHFGIEEFSIGMGPALFKHRSKKSGELFAVRLIPLGGYCAFTGEDGLEAEEESKKETEKDSRKEAEAEAAEGEAPPAPPPVDRSRYFTNRPCWQRIIVLLSGALMNFLLALVLILTGFFAYGQTMLAVYAAEEETDVPAEYRLSDYDILLQADGKNLYLTSDIARALNGKKKGDLVEFRVSRALGLEKSVDPATGETVTTYERREEMTLSVMLCSDVSVKNSADFTSVWRALGIKYFDGSEPGTAEGYALANAPYRFGFWETVGRSFVYSFRIAGSIFQVLGELLTGKLGITAFGGPVTTITMTSRIVSRGFRYFLEIAGYIGVNLAVFNLLPIPALDGSKVVFTAIEWIRKKPVSRKVEAIIHTVGLVLLLGFAILVDILQFV